MTDLPLTITDAAAALRLQIVGKPFDEATVLRVGDAFQQLTDWHLQIAPMAAEAEAALVG
jgi:Asp-tRNA(Asn)/Glu-tRNA(Gln) amidotransferase A subunit family amidase